MTPHDGSFPRQGSRRTAPAGLRIILQDVCHEVQSHHNKKEQIQLLTSVSAVAQPMQMTALMGPSGSGKTTLLDVLAGRKTTGTTTGVILFGNTTPSPAFLRRYTGYVEQFDTLIGSLTVTEMLMYTAELKRSISEPHSSKVQAVDDLVERLGLTSCAHVKIGDPLTKGISGGQAKRTNIGIALIADPKVLFLDEPTSGLDSYSSNEVVSLVQGLSREGTTVVATIHQPSAQAFAMFDQVLMLVKGRTAYFGPLGDACLQYTQQNWPGANGSHLECSLAEYLVDIVTDADRNGRANLLTEAYQASALKQETDALIDSYLSVDDDLHLLPEAVKKASMTSTEDHKSVRISESSGPTVHVEVVDPAAPKTRSLVRASSITHKLNTKQPTSTPWWWGLGVLLRYRTRVNYTNIHWLLARLIDKILFCFVITTLYLQTGDDSGMDNIVNINAALFMMVCLPPFGATTYMPSIILERPLFYRERADGLYYVATYFLAKMIEEIVIAALACLALSACCFYGVGFQGSFVLFWLIYFMTVAIGMVLGYFIAAAAPNIDLANTALFGYGVTLLFFAGQLKLLDSIPRYWFWFSRINFVRYSWVGLMVNQWEDNNPPFTAGLPVLHYFGLDTEKKWVQLVCLFPFFAVYMLLGYLSLAYIRWSKR